MTAAWNKEKLVFLSAIIAAVGVIALSVQAHGRKGAEIGYAGLDPKPPTAGTLEEPIPWVLPSRAEGRDPFQLISDWRPAVADALPAPPAPALRRRVPLPSALDGSARARPPRETAMPVEMQPDATQPEAPSGETGGK